MHSKRAARHWEGDRSATEAIVSAARPLVPPAPRSAMFFPLVVIVAVLPGLYALSRWDLTPPGPWWGLRGLAVVEGLITDQVPAGLGAGLEAEAWAYRAVAMQPPLYAWLEAVALALNPNRSPLATVLPSYLAGALVVVLVYLLGRLWHGPGLGLTAALLVGFNRELLLQMQQATPTTLGLAGVLLALLCYGRHLRPDAGTAQPWTWEGGVGWVLLGGGALGLSLLALAGFGLVCLPIVLLHQAYLGAGQEPTARPRRWWQLKWSNPSLVAGALAFSFAVALSAPWYLRMFSQYGNEFVAFLLNPPDSGGAFPAGLAERLVRLAPATLPLGLYSAVRLVRSAMYGDTSDRRTTGSVLWGIWLAVAALISTAWPAGPRSAFDLFLLVPLSLLAAQAVVDLSSRRIPVRAVTWLVPVTVLSIALWASLDLRMLVGPLVHARRPGSSGALVLHLGLDVLLALACVMGLLVRWAKRQDARQRLILAGFLVTVMATTMTEGLREVRFRHRETKDLLVLREVILRLHQQRPFDLVAVVGASPATPSVAGFTPGGRLRFVLRSALPRTPQVDLARTDDLLSLPSGKLLVILVGEQRLPYTLQAQLGLWAIHPGRTGVLNAFATAHELDQSVRR